MTETGSARVYDPEARRPTPLAEKLAARIRREGPISVEAYVRACLYDHEHGYYVRQPAIGAEGDFITAPEISQVFGELIGLWSAVVWQQMGSPARVRLTELGPGRGTLMADALRAARLVPAFLAALEVELVETNDVLRAAQKRALETVAVPIEWASRMRPGLQPRIVLANELLDTVPVQQRVLQRGSWMLRTVKLDAAGQLQFGIDEDDAIADQGRLANSRSGDIDEHQSHWPLLQDLAAGQSNGPGGAPLAALLLDYGHLASTVGETLQAVRRHRHEHPLTSPGEADLTCQVDFEVLAEKGRAAGLAVDGPTTQAEFLGALGVAERASRLMTANPAKAGDIELGVARLMSPTGMGTRFKAIGLRSTSVAPLPGFPGAGVAAR